MDDHHVDPLPSSVRDRVLGLLLPPNPPLPAELLSRAFLERLAFLPPTTPTDDGHLSPFPAYDGQSLYETLSELAMGCEPGPTEYAHDGEFAIARCPIHGGGHGVDVLFEHESGHEGRGWVYRGAVRAGGPAVQALQWADSLDNVALPSHGEPATATADDYWAGFTPPTPPAELPAHGASGDDDYWAQYRDGADTPGHYGAQTPALPATRKPSVDDATDHEVNAVSESLSAMAVPSSREGSSSVAILEEKIVAKTKALIRRAWADFAVERHPEEAAIEWLRLGRQVVDRQSWEDSTSEGNVLRAVALARLEAAREMYDVVNNDVQSMFRLVENAVYMPRPENDEEHAEYES